jgi:capsid protein
MNFFDQLISFFAPVSALRRQAARSQIQMLESSVRKYEGASNSDRLKLYNPTGSSANEEVRGGAVTLRQRARELRRNNAYAHRAIQVITTNVVGSGIKPVFQIGKNKAMKEFFDSAWDQVGRQIQENADFDGFHNIQGLQSQSHGRHC